MKTIDEFPTDTPNESLEREGKIPETPKKEKSDSWVNRISEIGRIIKEILLIVLLFVK